MRRPSRNLTRSSARLTRVADWQMDPEVLSGIQWQSDAYAYYRAIGQIRKVEASKANTMAACRLRLKQLNPETGQPEETESPEATRVWGAFVGPRGGKRELMRKYALLLDIGGEAFLIGVPNLDARETLRSEQAGDSPHLTWEFVSRAEIRGDRPDMANRKGRGLSRDAAGVMAVHSRPIPETAFIARDWTPDPQFSELPDSAMRSVIPDAEEYVKLRDVVSGAIRQRMAAGLLLVPGDASFGAFDETMEEEGPADDQTDPLLVDLETHMGAPILNRRDSAGYVPLIMMGDAEDLSQVRLVDLSFGNKNIEWATPLREEKLLMIGQTLDAPPEAMTGKADLNHWTGYSVDQELASKWVIPRGEQMAQFVTDEYLRPMLEEYENLTESEAARFVVVFDASNITARADKGVTAIRLYDRRLLSGSATVIANGFTEDEMPDEQERTLRFLTDLVLRDPSILTDTDVSAALGLDGLGIDLDKLAKALEPTGDQTPLGELPGETDTPGGPDEEGEGDIDTDAPDSGGGDVPGKTPDGAPTGGAGIDRLVHDLALIADGAAEAGLQKACSRLLNLAQKKGADPAVKDRLAGKPKDQVLLLTADEDLRRLGTTPEALTDGMWAGFISRATLRISRLLSDRNGTAQRNVGHETAHIVDELVSRLQMQVLDSAGDRRFDGLLVDETLISETLEAELGLVAV